ncbi:MAG: MFS transporter [Stappiaceae bacterium]
MNSSPRVTSVPPIFWQSVPFIIACGCLIGLLSYGPRGALGLFLTPITESREWSRETFALALAIQNLIWGAAQPIAGMLADRFGTARILSLGAVIYAAGLVLTAWAPTPLWLHISAGVMIGLGVAFASFSLVLATFGRVVTPEKRSIAFGLGTASGSFGQFLFAPLGQALLDGAGWQNALYVMAALLVLIPLFAIPLRGRAGSEDGSASQQQTMKQAIQEAFGYRGFLLLTAGFFVCGFHVSFIAVHLPAYIVDVGLSPVLGAWAIALIGLCNIFGAIGAGFIGNRYSKPIFLSLIYFSRAIVIALFVLLPVSPATVLIFAAAMGFLWLSTIPPTSALVAVMFGPRYMATLFGFIFFSHQLGSFLGVWLGGKIFDETGSYDAIWWIGVALGLFAAIVHWPIKDAPMAEVRAAGAA